MKYRVVGIFILFISVLIFSVFASRGFSPSMFLPQLKSSFEKISDQKFSSKIASKKDTIRILGQYGKLPLAFEDLKGSYLSRGRGYKVLLSPTEANLALTQQVGKQHERFELGREPENSPEIHQDFLKFKLLGANAKAETAGLDLFLGKSNYFIGNDPKKWATNIPQFAKVQFKEVYPGIDLVYS